jgi:hypothetical protein
MKTQDRIGQKRQQIADIDKILELHNKMKSYHDSLFFKGNELYRFEKSDDKKFEAIWEKYEKAIELEAIDNTYFDRHISLQAVYLKYYHNKNTLGQISKNPIYIEARKDVVDYLNSHKEEYKQVM